MNIILNAILMLGLLILVAMIVQSIVNKFDETEAYVFLSIIITILISYILHLLGYLF